MGKLVIHHEKITEKIAAELVDICPFDAIEYNNKKLDINSACKNCKLCVRKGPKGAITWEELQAVTIDKSKWKGIAVFAELELNRVHPVVFELIGKARELASKPKQEVLVVLIGDEKQVEKYTPLLLSYGPDKVITYSDPRLKNFNVQIHANIMEDFINKYKPSVVLYGGTAIGRSFAPRVAAHFKTGLTADCTKLGIKENTDLIQVRPAFGGNVMAQIICTNRRPQMATVRYKIFKKPEQTTPFGKVIPIKPKEDFFKTRIEILNIKEKQRAVDISEADIIVACGRAFKTKEDLKIAEELAKELGGTVAVSRPLVEAGLMEPKRQIGLSGKTVAPKLIITLGVSGSVQFVAGMNGSETIISINEDKNAPIFNISNYSIVGCVFKIVPKLIEKIRSNKEE